MGLAKELLMDMENTNYSVEENHLVCYNHFSDYAIVEHIKGLAFPGRCHYCGKKSKYTIDLESLLDFIFESINYFYEDPVNEVGYDSREGGYQICADSIIDTEDLIGDLLSLDGDKLHDDINKAVEHSYWVKKDPYALYMHEELKIEWKHFCDKVKHNTRFTFFKVKQFDDLYVPMSGILYSIGISVKELSLFTEINANDLLYRCRQHTIEEKVDDFSSLASPPTELANYPNRMSPAGVSMFYGSTDKDTAMIEVIDKNIINEKPYASIGTFNAKKCINLLNLTKLQEIEPSIFDKKNRDKIEHIKFIKNFVKDISKPIKQDNKVHTEYVPTQIVTEYFRYIFPEETKINLQGIIYNSSHNGEKCYVLFLDNKDCEKYLTIKNIDKINLLKKNYKN